MEHLEIIEEDMQMMKFAGYKMMPIGIFAWATLESEEDTMIWISSWINWTKMESKQFFLGSI